MNYNFFCEKHGEIILNLKMSEVKETMPCPLCKSEMERIYSPIADVWKCSGAFGKSN
jgi:hypothetical protein